MVVPSVHCLLCNTLFYVKPSHQKLGFGKYCSKECRSNAQLKGEVVSCYTCQKKIYRSLGRMRHSKSGNFFCSKTCQTRWRNSFFSEEKHPNWLGGTSSYREILLRTHRIQRCLCCDNNDSRVLIVHHIDHDRKNNDISNLIWVCLNCHFLIHHDLNFEKEFKKKITA